MVGWQTIRAGYRLLACDEEAVALHEPSEYALAGVGVLGVSAIWAAMAVGLWALGTFLFGGPGGFYPMEALLLGSVMLLGLYRRSAEALLEILSGENPARQALLGGLLAVGVIICLMVLKPDWYRTENSWGQLDILRPASKVTRVLILMPLWGAWSMWMLPQFSHGSSAVSPAISAMTKFVGPLSGAAMMGLLLAGTIGYMGFLPWTQLTISAATIAAALGGGACLLQRRGQLDLRVLRATNLLTQLTFLASYLANGQILIG